jgi:hypothetical protein
MEIVRYGPLGRFRSRPPIAAASLREKAILKALAGLGWPVDDAAR